MFVLAVLMAITHIYSKNLCIQGSRAKLIDKGKEPKVHHKTNSS